MNTAFAPTEEDFFANVNYSNNIECILPSAELLVTVRANGLRTKKPCLVYAEKMDFKGLLQLRIAEKCDQRRMYVTTIDSSSFNELKQDQSLHVTFAGFIENLVHLLQDCQAGKLEMSLVQSQSASSIVDAASRSMEYQLQFVEMRSFKNLIHLSLPSRLAPLNVVLFYMNNMLDAMQNKVQSSEKSVQQLQHEINVHLRGIEQLNMENAKIRDSLLENTKTLNQRHTEEMQHLQESLRKVSEQRHNDNERSQKAIASLQMQVEKLGAEKSNFQTEKLKEHKRIEALNEELVNVKSHLSSLKEQNEKLHGEIAALKNVERKNEMHLSDTRKHITELQEKLKKYEKNKADINAELEAEKKISQTKRQALEMATEEISKANEIILKQAQEILKLKKTIGWRTEVALQQEKAIKEKEQLLNLNNEEIVYMQKTIQDLRREIPKELESMRQFANTLEQKYSEQIKALREKMTSAGKENSPPYLTAISSNRLK